MAMTETGGGAVATVRWDDVRAEYESRQFTPAAICRRHGITEAQLRYRREMEHWPSLRAKPVHQHTLVARMLKVLDKQINQLEAAVNEPIDKQANVLATHIKSLDKLIEMGASRPDVPPPAKKDMTDLRNKLAKRLEQFNRR